MVEDSKFRWVIISSDEHGHGPWAYGPYGTTQEATDSLKNHVEHVIKHHAKPGDTLQWDHMGRANIMNNGKIRVWYKLVPVLPGMV